MNSSSQDNRFQVSVVDPNPAIVDLMKYNLENDGFRVMVYATAEALLEADLSATVLVVTEVQLGDINGLMLTSMLKNAPSTSQIPVIIVTALDSEDDIVKGFEAGADDYIMKPFSLREFMARVKAVLRRHSMAKVPVPEPQMLPSVSYGGLTVDPVTRTVAVDGMEVSLTRTEMLLLYTLMKRQGEHISHDELYDKVLHKRNDGASRALDVTVSRLRKKIGHYGRCIISRPGMGYGFIDNAEAV